MPSMLKRINIGNLCMFVVFVFLLILNILLPRQSDDFDAMFASKNGFYSAINSYMGWNGRIGELLHVSFIGGIPPYLFDLINAIIGSLFIMCFFILVFARLPKNRFDVANISLFMLILMYTLPFGPDFFWGSGSLNYLWGLFFIILFLIPYRLYYESIICNKKEGG